MKLRKQNNSGSVSIVIPKNVLKDLNWDCGDEIILKQSGANLVVKNLDKMEPEVSQEEKLPTMLEATNLWCDITNALIRKYKNMCDEDSIQALGELKALKKLLSSTGYLEV